MTRLSLIPLLLALLLGLPAAAQRETHPFNDGWQFKRGPFPADPRQAAAAWDGKWQAVSLPHTWNGTDMQRAANAYYAGPAYYRKSFAVPAAWKERRLFLRFEGVGACAEVYVNGQLAGTHRGAYSAFAVEISGLVKPGQDNEVVVLADNAARPDVIPVNHQLFGVYGGIYRPVSLIVTAPCQIAVTDHASPGVYISQRDVSARSAEVDVRVKLDNGGLQPQDLRLETVIADREGREVARRSSALRLTPQGTQAYVHHYQLRRPHLWNGRPDPYLYRVTARLWDGGQLIDEVVQPLGLRHIEAVAGRGILLNGKPYPMHGTTRHQDWPDIGSALTTKEHDTDLRLIMEMGATTVRLAHYQQADYVYARCDSLGLLVWAEIPFVNRVTGKEWDNAHQQLRELIRQSYNHPSIYVWGLHNEVYQPHAYTAALTQSLHDLAKTEDPGRYTAAVNGYGRADHPVNMNADIQGMNRYFGWYEGRVGDIEAWVSGLEKDYPDMPLMLTEYGADANLAHQTETLGEALDWTKPYYPETFQTKVHEQQWSVIARHPYILASYLWNTFDFACPAWSRGGVPARNLKGLVTFDRRTRKDAYYWYKANWNSEPMIYLTQRRNVEREHRVTSVTVYSNAGAPRLWLNGRPLPAPRRGLTAVHYVADSVRLDSGMNEIRAEVRTPEGRILADTVRWRYAGEAVRAADATVHEGEHSGF